LYPRLPLPLIGSTAQSHDVMVALAVIAAALLGYRWIVRVEGLEAWRVRWALALIALATFAGARLHFALANWDLFREQPLRVLHLSSAGLHAPGGILGAVIGSAILLPLLRIPAAKFADGLAPAVGVGIALARLGCFLHGCCFGGLCPYPWGVTLPADSYVFMRQLEARLLAPGAVRSLPIHPLPLYFAAAGLAITAFLLWLRPRKRYDGQLALWLLVLFSASSALLEPIRADDPMRVYWGPLPQLLWVAAGMTALSVALLALAEYRHRQPRRAANPAVAS
jgi:phosphatidylglycerol:prolipoprotein diacylglycerol transferase